MNVNFVKYLAVLLDAGPEIKDQIQENYDFLMDIKNRMFSEDQDETSATSVRTSDQWCNGYPAVASICEKAGPPRVASGESRAAGFLTDLINGFTRENLNEAIELVLALKKFFGLGCEETSQNDGAADDLVDGQA